MPSNLRRELTNLPNLVTMGRVGDFLDGYLARSRGEVSMLGKFLDPLADKLIVNAVLVYMVALGRVPAWIVVVIIGRDLAVNGLRSIASAQGLVIAASDGGKIKTALQLVAIMMLLVYFRYPVLGTSIMLDYYVVGNWILFISMGVSLFSGVQYLRHFLSAALRQSRAST